MLKNVEKCYNQAYHVWKRFHNGVDYAIKKLLDCTKDWKEELSALRTSLRNEKMSPTVRENLIRKNRKWDSGERGGFSSNAIHERQGRKVEVDAK
ncbi:hypothetical protein GOP47_0023340 [Adiantum capillus-veneris]|uniref:Uncharacterized protein n=1 Tax=Adiantum capillus-veneris TaxID=13818 RepID=A0A9D4Z4F2_ADICA|nr:hypothetical protein GOP47_0023340 [Adiantum capillus-veneris]